MAVLVKKEKHSQLGPEVFIIDDTQLLYNYLEDMMATPPAPTLFCNSLRRRPSFASAIPTLLRQSRFVVRGTQCSLHMPGIESAAYLGTLYRLHVPHSQSRRTAPRYTRHRRPHHVGAASACWPHTPNSALARPALVTVRASRRQAGHHNRAHSPLLVSHHRAHCHHLPAQPTTRHFVPIRKTPRPDCEQ